MPPGAGSEGKKPNILLLVGVIVGALILVGGIIFAVISLQGADFAVGGCVQQEGNEAKAIACDDVEEGQSGIYEITQEVDDRAECDDPTQPIVELDGGSTIYCLKPYGQTDAPAEDEPADGETE